MKTIILDHNDLDAAGCYIVLQYLNIKYDLITFNDYDVYEDEHKKKLLFEYDAIICTDYSLSKSLCEEILNNGKELIILDHHESSKLLKEINHPKFTLIHDETKCGTEITFDFFKDSVRYKKSIIDFIRLVGTYDLFKTQDPLWEDAQNLNRTLYGCMSWNNEENPYDFISSYWLNKISTNNNWIWTDFEMKKIKRALEIENEQILKGKIALKKHIDEKGIPFGVTVVNKKVSIVGLTLLKENTDIKYLVIINNYSGKWDKISLRSRDENEFDCTQIANGHKCAAGLEINPIDAELVYKGKKYLSYKVLENNIPSEV